MYTMREDCPIAFATEVVGKKEAPPELGETWQLCVPTSAQDARKHGCSLISQVTTTSEAQSSWFGPAMLGGAS